MDAVRPRSAGRPMSIEPSKRIIETLDGDACTHSQRRKFLAVIEDPETEGYVLGVGRFNKPIRESDKLRGLIHDPLFGLFPEYVNGFLPE